MHILSLINISSDILLRVDLLSLSLSLSERYLGLPSQGALSGNTEVCRLIMWNTACSRGVIMEAWKCVCVCETVTSKTIGHRFHSAPGNLNVNTWNSLSWGLSATCRGRLISICQLAHPQSLDCQDVSFVFILSSHRWQYLGPHHRIIAQTCSSFRHSLTPFSGNKQTNVKVHIVHYLFGLTTLLTLLTKIYG